ncbi:MAG: ATP-binding protein [Saprospiraceae bacterium]|nr:ATP-binding protein [Candidatus Opimibacter iunctus]
MTDHKPFIITIVGPESSGKTTLARKLAAYLGCPWVPEYAREYLEGLGRRYEEADLKEIAAGQLEAISRASNGQLAVGSGQWAFCRFVPEGGESEYGIGIWKFAIGSKRCFVVSEEAFGAVERPVLIVDSGMLSLRMWARIKYGSEIPIVETALKEDITSMYRLCRPLAIWEPDTLREAPLLLDRAWIYNHYLAELSASLLT